MIRNALIPVVTILGPILAYLVTGSFIIETIFGIPGIGRYYITSIGQKDYGVLMATTLHVRVSPSRSSTSWWTSCTPTSTRGSGTARSSTMTTDALRGNSSRQGDPRPGPVDRRVRNRLRKNRLAVMIGLILVILLFFVAVIGPFIAPYPYQVQDLSRGCQWQRAVQPGTQRISSAPTGSDATC